MSCAVPIDARPGRAGALYNMALAGTGVKVNLSGAVGVNPASCLDKLRLSAWTVCPASAFLRVCEGRGTDFRHGGPSRSRNLGKRRRWKTWASWTGDGGGTVYVQVEHVESLTVADSSQFIIEFNPSKCTRLDFSLIAGLMRALESSAPVVERVDYAVTYPIPRGLLMLDDRQRAMDMFGVGAWGPETERTGFRRGAPVQFQLYDKRAERLSKGVDIGENATRFELTVNGAYVAGLVDAAGKPLHPDGLRLRDLPGLPWAGGDVTVRAFTFDPATIHDEVFAWAALACRGLGVRTVLAVAKRLGWRLERREQFLACCVPELGPSPAVVWAARFRADASRVVDLLVDGERGHPLPGNQDDSFRREVLIDWGDGAAAGEQRSAAPAASIAAEPDAVPGPG